MQRKEPELFAQACDLEALLIARRRELGRDPVYLTRFGRPLGEVFAARRACCSSPTTGRTSTPASPATA